MTDDELAASFVARRPEALEDAYRAYAPALYSVARHVLGSDADAQDCVHDALMRVWNRPGAYRPERGSLRTFLSVCVRNEAIGRKREAARHFHIERRLVATERDEPYEFEVDDFVERGRLREALATLSDEQRQALELAYFGYLSHTQIAEKLGVPLGTIKSRLALGLRKLQAVFPTQPTGTI
jgi:RNA polymerase sigma-70 factor (ECF subfamily)